ncbi:hypothetical protein A1O1_05059 [Capronia coronata CBS 617.96]|uniref:Major facilitator superfamily (MFS) profile domain-containing protein n=1 Tax=Capronia coronata CBS 617.96 TaxID=1182541 RepID=W9YFU6_9EURO|nr:uncharacterized protein A1O1_05059 [Capronia coronata CBS 617.96]EXJ88131.1 hypothetical protein A1O1_05059 [Capronia coronata CBS 617.96]
MTQVSGEGDPSGSTNSPGDEKRSVTVTQTPITKVSGRGRFDVAAEFLNLHAAEHGSYTAAEARRVLWKIDIRLIPLMTLTVILNALDKIIVSNAAIYGMTKDCHLHGQQYSWVASIFYFGYLVAEFPANLMIQKYPVGKLIGIAALCWGAMVTLLAACSNAAGLMTLRFFMGMFEAPMFPVCAVTTVMWYKKDEQPLRTAIWFGQFSSLFSGIVSYGIGHIHSGIASWRLLFIVMGLFTLCWGTMLYFFMPDSPLDCRFLNDREKYIAVHRIKDNMTGIENKTIKWYQVREAFTDWKTWPLAVYCLCINIANGGFYSFSAQIISGLGFPALETTLLNMPIGVIATLCSIAVTIPGTKFKNMRCISAATVGLVPIACCVLMMKLPLDDKYGRLAVYYVAFTYWAGYAMVTSLPMANTSGHSKKVARNAIMFLSYCLGNIIAPQFFRASEAPEYPTAYRAILSGITIAMACLVVYGVGVHFENRKMVKRGDTQRFVEEASTDEILLDITDKEKKGFVYVY